MEALFPSFEQIPECTLGKLPLECPNRLMVAPEVPLSVSTATPQNDQVPLKSFSSPELAHFL